jgi:DHA3 family tetracycline resistance protein-like MFS transporter
MLIGSGMVLNGLFARFETILFAQVIWAAGYTFISGAKEAWIADEIGAQGGAGRVFMRGAAIETVARTVSIPIGTAIGLISLRLPIILGGVCFLPLGFFLATTMTEHGFKPQATSAKSAMRSLSRQSFAGWRTVRASPLLVTILFIGVVYGLAAGSFDRLWVAQFSTNIGLPKMWHLQPVIWFGVLRTGGALLGAAAGLIIQRRLDADDHHVVSRGLFWCYWLQMSAILVIAVTTSFWIGLLAFWLITGITRFYIPLNLAWINQNVDSSVRATVLSMSSQSDSMGRIAGAPWLGMLGWLVDLRWAFAAASLVMLPGLGLFRRAFKQGPPPVPGDEAAFVRLYRPANDPPAYRIPRSPKDAEE